MSNLISTKLLHAVHEVAGKTPARVQEALIGALHRAAPFSPAQERAQILREVPLPEFRDVVQNLLDVWQQEADNTPPAALALALACAAHAYQAAKAETAIELVWTGPVTGVIPLRRTEQALLQLIRAARSELLIVSFAVYDIEEIVRALETAVARGVALTLVFEDPASSGGKITFNAGAALGDTLRRKARILQWSASRRAKDAQGRHGSLHAKCAVADQQQLFISSANLTAYALNLNMELGLLVHNGGLAAQVAAHFQTLLMQGILTSLDA